MFIHVFVLLIFIAGALFPVVLLEVLAYRKRAETNQPEALAYLKQRLGVIACYAAGVIPLVVAMLNFNWIKRIATTIHPIDIVLFAYAYENAILLASGFVMWHFEPEAKHRLRLRRGVKMFCAFTAAAYLILIGLHYLIPSLATAATS